MSEHERIDLAIALSVPIEYFNSWLAMLPDDYKRYIERLLLEYSGEMDAVLDVLDERLDNPKEFNDAKLVLSQFTLRPMC
jgi:hypothetical protein